MNMSPGATKTLGCLRCGQPVEVARHAPRAYCQGCRQEVRAEWERRKHAAYYRKNKKEILEKCARYYASHSPAQRRRYADSALERYHRNQQLLRTELLWRSVRQLGEHDLSIVSERYLVNPLFIIVDVKGRRHRENLNAPLLIGSRKVEEL